MREIPSEATGPADTSETDGPPPSRAVVVRPRPAPAVSWPDRVRTVLRRVPELARDPAVAATTAASAAVVGQLAFRELRRALGSGTPSPTAVNVTAVIVHRVHVVHHYVWDADVRRALPPG